MKRLSEIFFFLFLVTVSVILLFNRLNYCHVPFDRDEGEYAYAGSLLLQGHFPYKEAYNMKFPGSYFMYALLMKAGGENIEAVRIGVCFIVLLTALLLGRITHMFTKNAGAAALAAVVFLSLTNTMGGEGIMANAEHFVNLFAVSGIFVLFLFLKRPNKPGLLFFAGIMLGSAVIMKQYGYAFCLFGLVLLVTEFVRKSPYTLVKNIAVFSAGCALPVLLLFSWILKNGLWEKFLFLTIKYAYAYVGLGSGNIGKTLTTIAHSAVPVWVLVCISLLVVLGFFRQKNARILIAWVIFSIMAFSTGFYLRVHYFILVYPALAVVTGYAYYLVSGKISFIMGKLAAMFLLSFLALDKEEQFPVDTAVVYNKFHHWGMFADMPKIARRVNEFIPATDKLSLFASEPEIFFYARKVAASGYIYNYPFYENQRYAGQMMDEFKAEVMANPSPLFVYYTGSLDKNQCTVFEQWWSGYSKNFDLKDVYIPVSIDSGTFLGEEKIKADTSWKNEGIRAEFWMRKN